MADEKNVFTPEQFNQIMEKATERGDFNVVGACMRVMFEGANHSDIVEELNGSEIGKQSLKDMGLENLVIAGSMDIAALNVEKTAQDLIQDLQKDAKEFQEIAADDSLQNVLTDLHDEIDKGFEAATAVGITDVAEAHHMAVDELQLEDKELRDKSGREGRELDEKIIDLKRQIEILKLEKQKAELERDIKKLRTPFFATKEKIKAMRNNISKTAENIGNNVKDFAKSVAHIPKDAYDKSKEFIQDQANKAKGNLNAIMSKHHEKQHDRICSHIQMIENIKDKFIDLHNEKLEKQNSFKLARMHFRNSLPFVKRISQEEMMEKLENQNKNKKKDIYLKATEKLNNVLTEEHKKSREHNAKRKIYDEKKNEYWNKINNGKTESLGLDQIDKTKAPTKDVVQKAKDFVKDEMNKAADNCR